MTVIIPCYNAARFICDAIDSVLSQADTDVECIVVDDGSTDGSAELVARTYPGRVRVVRQANAGVAHARNCGLAHASGELVAWLDADDTLAPHTLPLRRRAFFEEAELEMLAGQVEVVDVDTQQTFVSPQRCGADYLTRDLLARTNLPHLNVLTFRKEVCERLGGFDPDLKIVDDFDFWLRAWATLRWKFERVVLSVQRTGTYPSLSRSETKVFINEQVGMALRKNRELVHRVTGSDAAWRVGYSRFAADFALLHLKNGDRKRARAWVVEAFRIAPMGVERRAYIYALEALLPPSTYAAGRAAVLRVRALR